MDSSPGGRWAVIFIVWSRDNPVKYTDPDGNDFHIVVSKSMGTLVATYTPNKDYPSYPRVNNYNSAITFTLSVITNVVANNPNNTTASDGLRIQNSNNGGAVTHPTQMANGTYNLSIASPSSTVNPGPYYKYGEPGNGLFIHITQMLEDVNSGEMVPDTGYMVHITPNNYTDGCIGIPYDREEPWTRHRAERVMDKLVDMCRITLLRNELATIEITN
jgi:hypothetical protein